MLDIARRKQARAKIGPELTFVEADAENLPFEDDRYCDRVRRLRPEKRGRHRSRSGRNDARLCSRWQGRRPRIQHAPLAAAAWHLPLLLPPISCRASDSSSPATNPSAYEYLPATVAQFPDGEQLAERMRGVGLKNIKYWPLTLGIATLYIGKK